MSSSNAGSGTGTFQVTEGYLQDFAKNKINNFILGLRPHDSTDPAGYGDLSGFAGGPAGPGGYSKLMTGNDPSAKALQQRYAAFCKSLQSQLDALMQSMTNMSTDLLTVDSILGKGEQNAQVSAQQMMQDLQNILSGLRSSPASAASLPSTPATGGLTAA